MDQYLAEHGGIRLWPDSHQEWNAVLLSVLSKSAYEAMSRLNGERKRFPASLQLQQEFYDLMSGPADTSRP